MQWVQNGPRLDYPGYDECSGYGMGHAWVTENMMNAVGTEWVTPGLLSTMMNAVGMEWVTPGLQRIMMNAVDMEWVTPGLLMI